MPPPRNGNAFMPFTELIDLEKLDDSTFRSIVAPFCPGGKLPRAVGATYGGHVFCQAAWAAAQTVKSGLLIYNITGSFILPGQPQHHFTYTVQRIRDGRSSCTRIVHATQDPAVGICFTCTVAFRAPEPSPLEIQDKQPSEDGVSGSQQLWRRYSAVLHDKAPSSFPPIPGMDVPWYWQHLRDGGTNDEFPGLEMTQVPMSAYNDQRHPLDKRLLMFYRPLLEGLPADQPNLHLCAHLYASDRNSLYVIANFMDVGDLWKSMGSLVHSVVFHSPMEALRFRPSELGEVGNMDDREGTGRWFCLEDRADRAGGGRLMYHSRVWNASGDHVMTIMQDGMVRFSAKPEATKEEIEEVERRMSNWKSREKL